MLAVSDTIKNAYNKYKTQRKSYIKVGDNSFFIQNLDLSADSYYEGNVIGNAIAKIAKFDMETVNVSGIDEFELFDGIWTGNQYEYISLGTFKLFDEIFSIKQYSSSPILDTNSSSTTTFSPMYFSNILDEKVFIQSLLSPTICTICSVKALSLD